MKIYQKFSTSEGGVTLFTPPPPWIHACVKVTSIIWLFPVLSLRFWESLLFTHKKYVFNTRTIYAVALRLSYREDSWEIISMQTLSLPPPNLSQ